MKINEIDPGTKLDISAANTIDHFIELIHTHCSEAIAGMKQANKFLYRGINNVPDMFHGKPRENRKPYNSERANVQKLYDRALSSIGCTALRNNSIFCTADPNMAAIYSDSGLFYCIFPVNGFNFTWSPDIKDPVNDSDFNWMGNKNNPDFYTDFVKLKHYTNGNFSAALTSGNEIMISGEYYAVIEAAIDRDTKYRILNAN